MGTKTFNFAGFFYQKGISDIRIAYDATIAGLERSRDDATSEAIKIAKDISEGRMEACEYSEDGEVLYGNLEYADHKIDSMKEAIDLAREAYMLILYHHWEKFCARWMGKTRYTHDDARKWTRESDIPFEDKKLDLLRMVTNYTKHHKTTLFDLHPELFDFLFRADGSIGDSRLKLTADFVDAMFDAVRKSGHQMMIET